MFANTFKYLIILGSTYLMKTIPSRTVLFNGYITRKGTLYIKSHDNMDNLERTAMFLSFFLSELKLSWYLEHNTVLIFYLNGQRKG